MGGVIRGVRETSDHSSFDSDREHYLCERGIKEGPAGKALGAAIGNGFKTARAMGMGDFLQWHWYLDALTIGHLMEETVHLIQAINAEVEESKRVLTGLSNDVRAVFEIVGPQLLQQAKELRAARMTVVAEIRDSLAALRDVRRFFLESEYSVEMDRLERFVRLCKELRVLKESGILDAVADTAIRLAVREEHS